MRNRRARRLPSWPRASQGSWWQHIHRCWALRVLLAASDRSCSLSFGFWHPCAPCPVPLYAACGASVTRKAVAAVPNRSGGNGCRYPCASTAARRRHRTAAARRLPRRQQQPRRRRLPLPRAAVGRQVGALGVPAPCLHSTHDGRLIVDAVTVGTCRHVLWAKRLLPPTRRRRVSCGGTAQAVTAVAASCARRRGILHSAITLVVAATATGAAAGLAPCQSLLAGCRSCLPAPQPRSHLLRLSVACSCAFRRDSGAPAS